MQEFATPDFPVKDFVEASLRLHRLEKSRGIPFDDIDEEYSELQQKVEQLREEVDTLVKSKSKLSEEIKTLSLLFTTYYPVTNITPLYQKHAMFSMALGLFLETAYLCIYQPRYGFFKCF